MRTVILLALLIAGCAQSANTSNHATKLQEYVDGWNKMGMWLPDQSQIDSFRLCLPESQKPLATALENPSYEIRMRAAYVIEKLGTDARPIGPALLGRLQNEPDRLVRLYLYDALSGVRYGERQALRI